MGGIAKRNSVTRTCDLAPKPPFSGNQILSMGCLSRIGCSWLVKGTCVRSSRTQTLCRPYSQSLSASLFHSRHRTDRRILAWREIRSIPPPFLRGGYVCIGVLWCLDRALSLDVGRWVVDYTCCITLWFGCGKLGSEVKVGGWFIGRSSGSRDSS